MLPNAPKKLFSNSFAWWSAEKPSECKIEDISNDIPDGFIKASNQGIFSFFFLNANKVDMLL